MGRGPRLRGRAGSPNPPGSGSIASVDARLLRTLGIVLLVLLIVVLGLPLAVGMGGMGRCPDCQTAGGFSLFGIYLAIFGTLMLLSLGTLGGVVAARSRRLAFVSAGALERPPRFSSV